MSPTTRKRLTMVSAGAIPGIAIASGLLSLDADSALRQEYWPWLPLVTLAFGLGASALFWLVLAPRRDRDG